MVALGVWLGVNVKLGKSVSVGIDGGADVSVGISTNVGNSKACSEDDVWKAVRLISMIKIHFHIGN
jgi:hypothetical protein